MYSLSIEKKSNLIGELTSLKIKLENGIELTDIEQHRFLEIENTLIKDCDTCANHINRNCNLGDEGCQTSMYEQYYSRESNQDYFECVNDYSDGTMSV
jgi:hypothetical protein